MRSPRSEAITQKRERLPAAQAPTNDRIARTRLQTHHERPRQACLWKHPPPPPPSRSVPGKRPPTRNSTLQPLECVGLATCLCLTDRMRNGGCASLAGEKQVCILYPLFLLPTGCGKAQGPQEWRSPNEQSLGPGSLGGGNCP